MVVVVGTGVSVVSTAVSAGGVADGAGLVSSASTPPTTAPMAAGDGWLGPTGIVCGPATKPAPTKDPPEGGSCALRRPGYKDH